MKKILLLLFIAAASLVSNAQTTINNAGMENWTGSGQTIEPQYWNSTKSAGGSCGLCISSSPQTCWQETSNPHGGTYCAKLVTGNVLGTNVNGALTTGQITIPSFTAAEGFIQTVTTDANFRMNFTGRPDSLVFWYRSTPVGSDYPSVEARIHINTCEVPEIPVNGNHTLDTNNIVARAGWQGTSAVVGTWTRVSIPFVYRNGTTPQYILITSTSSGSTTSAQQYSTLWLDDFDVIYNPTIATGTISPLSYYVSATTGSSVSVPFTLTGTYNGGNTVTAQLSDASGSFASPTVIGSLATTTSGTINATIPANTATGTGYRIRVVSSSPALTAANNGSDISITLVGNSIAPSTAQTIAANTNGTPITVTETPAASSREWKYSTTSGSGYVSFAPTQTGTTYTPNFAATGTYYVVCVSSFPTGVTVTSNEVVINVVANSIAPPSPQTILVGVNGTALTVTETPAGTWREWKYSTTSGSGYISFAPAITGATTYTPNFATAGTYYVICQSLINGVTVYSNEVMITVVTNSIAPASAQNIQAGVSGNMLTVTETPAAISREWKYSATSGSGYVSFAPAQTSASYTPNFPVAGTYYVVCVSSFSGGVTATSNEVAINVVSNSIAPTTSQSILVGVNGTMLTVTETPPGSWREWLYSTTSGSGYVSFAPALTGVTTYTPNFASAGNYYLVCQSLINGVTVFSNEVLISVGNATITTGTVSGSPFLFSPSALDASVNVPYITSGTFNNGNVFTAQLSDASGSFNSPVDLGTFTATTSGTVLATILHTTAAGTGYRIRVVSDNPIILGSDNGVDLVIDQFNNSIAPSTTQTIQYNTNGSAVTVTASQSATHEWKYSTISGSGYVSFAPAETGSSYTPNFPIPGTYYVVCASTNTYSDVVTSNEVQIDVTNGSTITTSTVNGSPFFVSATMTAAVNVDFTSDVVFNSGNIFTAQLSDNSGSFANPVNIGTLNGTTVGTIAGNIPSNSVTGNGYRIRVISSNPAVTGSNNGADLVIDQFSNSIAPATTQTIMHGVNGSAITVTESQSATHQWKYSTTSGSGYVSFAPAQTGSSYTPSFPIPGTYYVVCVSTNTYSDAVTSNEAQIDVTNGSTITTSAVSGSPFLVSASMTAPVSVDFTSDVVFNAGNIFKAQLSDNTGSFASPVEIGTYPSATIGTISATIPSSSVAGTAYRIRVISTNPVVTGSDNGTNLQVIPFEISIAPVDTQYLVQGQNGNAITVTETHTATRVWKYSQASGIGYAPFTPNETGASLIPHFNIVSPYYIICESTNSANDKLTSQEVVVMVTALSGIDEKEHSIIKAYWSGNDFVVDLSASELSSPIFELMNISGQVMIKEKLISSSLNHISTNLPEGIYVFRIMDGAKIYSGNTSKK